MIDVRHPDKDRTARCLARRAGPGRLFGLGRRRGRRRGRGQRQGHPGGHHELRRVRLERPRHALPQSDLRQGRASCPPTTPSGSRSSSGATRPRSSPPASPSSTPSAATRISYGKRSYGQFWDNSAALFGIALLHDTGLNLEDPGIHNGLAGTMVVKGDHFQVNGVPVVPVDDTLAWNPYQVADIIVRDSGTNAVLVQTRATVPTSDEINCGRCHGADPLLDVLEQHDDEEGTTLAANRPVLCASCHGSPGLGQSGPGSSGKYLSQAIHGFHSSRGSDVLRLPPRPDHPMQPEHGPHLLGRQLRDLPRDDGRRGQLRRLRQPDPMGRRASVRDLPRRDRRDQHGHDALPERLGAQRHFLPGLPRQPPRPGPDEPGLGRLSVGAVPDRRPADRDLQGLP